MPYRPPSRRAVTPQHQGRYSGYDVLQAVETWDDLTAGVVLARLDPPTDFSFFDPSEQACAGALFDLILAQHTEPRVPVLALVDQRLALGQTDGWFYEDMPPDVDAWHASLAGLDADARSMGAPSFARASLGDQSDLVEQCRASDCWHDMPGGHVWSLWTRYACAAFYSHPWAWNEIGFGGPAYPRGYKALGVGKREGWEVSDADGRDPVSWAQRVEHARRRHAERFVRPGPRPSSASEDKPSPPTPPLPPSEAEPA